YRAGLMALRRAVEALDPQPQHLLIDARRLDGLPMPQQPIIKGDAKSITIGAASIVAKVHRDRLMAQLDGEYPGYGFSAHKGYPTPDHLDALERLGACALHRSEEHTSELQSLAYLVCRLLLEKKKKKKKTNTKYKLSTPLTHIV